MLLQRALAVGGIITVWLVSNLIGFDSIKQENMLLFLCTEATEYKPVKLETSHTVILSLLSSVLWLLVTY